MNTLTNKKATAGFVAAACLIVLGLTSDGFAHDGNDHAISSQKLKMSWDQAQGKRNKFQYKTKGQIEINDSSVLGQDPTQVTSTIVVRGTGSGDGDTGVIVLDPAKWSAQGSKGWKYKDDPRLLASGGVKQIKIKTNPKGGQLQIKAQGAFWGYDIFQPQSGVEIMLSMGDAIFCAQYGTDPSELTKNEGTPTAGRVQGKEAGIITGGECPSACGNGILELGEECDDGNTDDGDTCSNSCEGCDAGAIEFDSTFEGIQSLIFDNPTFGCSTATCHGASEQGDLDLRDGTSYGELINVASPNFAGNPLRVFPGDQDLSLLFSKLAHATEGTPTLPNTGTPMPAGGLPALTPELLEAVRLWIRGGAPEDTVVEGTAELLGACLPSASPNKIPQPDPPAPAEGTQFLMPGYPLNQQSERELCISSYFDVSATIPASLKIPCPGLFGPNNDTDECFAWDYSLLAQDPQSHHSIIHIYTGDYDTTDPGWGGWRCYQGANDGQTCDPLQPSDCPDGICGGDDEEGIACIGYGPPDYSNANGTAPTFGGSQEATGVNDYPGGVYGLHPLKGIIVWNSHAFNLTGEDMRMEAYLNMLYTNDLQYPANALFDTKAIFIQDVDPYDTEEYCDTFTFPEGTHLFDLSSHTHRHGKRWRYYQAPQTPCPSANNCSPGDPGDIFYESFEYADPLYLQFDPPMVYSGSVNDRTVKYCALYDNGAADPSEIKRRSLTPFPPSPFAPGGPCELSEVKCLAGPNAGQLCNGIDSNCPGSICDACNVVGGVTTEDEMFIPLGTYYIVP